MADEQSPLMLIPSEIRLAIYQLLLNDNGHKTLEIRNEDPESYKRHDIPSRTSYRIIGRDLTRRSQSTTYHLTTDTEMHTSIMGVNRKIYEETSYLLYGSHTFSFGRDIEAMVPFFSDMTKQTRPLLHEIALVKQGSVYTRDYDRCEWRNLCEFLSNDMRIGSLRLVVEGGRPSLGWDNLPQYTMADFKTLAHVKYESLNWVWELLSIKGIQSLDVSSEIHHCPPSHSSAMELFAAFSASIEKGFADFLRSEMLVQRETGWEFRLTGDMDIVFFSWVGFQLIGTRAEAEVVHHVFCILTIIMSCLETGGNRTFV
ncbi:hypothetical protein LSUB1_G005895 [Lachnellula subtilissima]|uniref:DUF7730 domain-containing protein n=1 Tax=Lachnellula subtilissima TaxID=602034 RepID=A0A8H8RKB4_9HELO|nr:hypothetical protein LSUB1_G005895 [Lachnellula subtilissima]